MKYLMGVFFVALLALSSTGVAALGFNTARVRAIHASPDAPDVDVWANGEILFEGAPYKGVTGYKSVPVGKYNVQVVPTGETEPVVIDEDLRFRPLRDYTVVAIDQLDSIEALVFEDRRYPVPRFMASVRFIHASPGTPNVDVAVKDGPTLFENVGFGDSDGYKRVPQGTYDLEVRVAGTDTVALEVPGVELHRGVRYSAIAVGLLEPEEDFQALDALLVEDRRAFGR